MKTLSLYAMALLLSFGLIQPSFADSQDAVFIENTDKKVVDKWGKCVRTKWMGDEDPCAPPAPEPAPIVKAPPPPPEPKILASKEDRTVYFDFDSDMISAAEGNKLDSLAALVNRSRTVSGVKMIGFADPYGSDKYNMALSQKRVSAVEAYLGTMIKKPISNAEIRAEGELEAQEECKSLKKRAERIACMRPLRRVEVHLERTYLK